jgi:hypothetical protein
VAESEEERRRHRRKEARETASEAASEAGEGAVEAVADGCGCDINLLIALTLFAGVPLLLWAV